VVALEGDQDRAVGEPGERLGVLGALAGERPSLRVGEGADPGLAEADQPAALVGGKAGGEPAALVGDGDEAGAVGIDQQPGEAAKAPVRRGEREAAAELEGAEPGAGAVLGVERLAPGGDLDRLAGGVGWARGGLDRRQQGGDEQAQKGDRFIFRPENKSVPFWGQARRRAGPRGRWTTGASSSNSSASFSSMVPPSCSASTMVTARA